MCHKEESTQLDTLLRQKEARACTHPLNIIRWEREKRGGGGGGGGQVVETLLMRKIFLRGKKREKQKKTAGLRLIAMTHHYDSSLSSHHYDSSLTCS